MNEQLKTILTSDGCPLYLSSLECTALVVKTQSRSDKALEVQAGS